MLHTTREMLSSCEVSDHVSPCGVVKAASLPLGIHSADRFIPVGRLSNNPSLSPSAYAKYQMFQQLWKDFRPTQPCKTAYQGSTLL